MEGLDECLLTEPWLSEGWPEQPDSLLLELQPLEERVKLQ